MARFSVCGGDDGERSNHSNHRSRKRQRLSSIDEYEEHSEGSYAEGSGEEDEEETQNRGSEMESDNQVVYTSDDSDSDVLVLKRINEKSLSNQDSSSSKSSPLSVTLSDPDVLDCPICFEPLKIPIFQCDNGHLACSLCCTKVRNRCPSCTLPIGYSRNRAMENIIETSRVSCRNAKYGCKESTSYGNRFTHEKLCAFNPCSCPIPDCNYTSNYKDLNNHVRDSHRRGPIPFYCNTSFTIYLDFYETTTMYMEEDDGCVIVVQSFRTSSAALISVSCIAPLAPEVSDFSCSLINETDNGLLKQSFMVKNIQKVKDEQPEDGFILIPSYMLDGESFKMQICISRGRILV